MKELSRSEWMVYVADQFQFSVGSPRVQSWGQHYSSSLWQIQHHWSGISYPSTLTTQVIFLHSGGCISKPGPHYIIHTEFSHHLVQWTTLSSKWIVQCGSDCAVMFVHTFSPNPRHQWHRFLLSSCPRVLCIFPSSQTTDNVLIFSGSFLIITTNQCFADQGWRSRLINKEWSSHHF